MNQPEFTAYEINALRVQKDKSYLSPERRKQLAEAYKSVMEIEERRIHWGQLSEPQQKRMWAIKYMCKEMVNDD